MEKMEFIYTSGWEKFEQYCKPRKKKRIRGGSENERFKNIRFTVCSDG